MKRLGSYTYYKTAFIDSHCLSPTFNASQGGFESLGEQSERYAVAVVVLTLLCLFFFTILFVVQYNSVW